MLVIHREGRAVSTGCALGPLAVWGPPYITKATAAKPQLTKHIKEGVTMQNIDKIKGKVQKLLNQAADREGTPEGDSFYAKAFRLMATYGFDERDLTSPDEGDEVIHKIFVISGPYSDMQARLLLAISGALHCVGFMRSVPNSTRAENVTVFGLKRHIERVGMLYSLLVPVMFAGAKRLTSQEVRGSVVVRRRSFMTGFATKTGERLAEAEDTVAAKDGGYGLVLMDDHLAAEAARDSYAEEHGLVFGSGRRTRTYDANAYYRGMDAGALTDLGQTRVQSRPALPF